MGPALKAAAQTVAPDRVLPLGVVMRRTPGATRWARHAWRAVAVLPGAGEPGRVLREDGPVAEIHAATLALGLWRSDAEAYRVGLSAPTPRVFVVLRPGPPGAMPVPVRATASPYEAQDFGDSADDVVEPVPMPDGLAALIAAFAAEHFEAEPFVKRRRDRARTDGPAGRGDGRIRGAGDVYRAPGGDRGAA